MDLERQFYVNELTQDGKVHNKLISHVIRESKEEIFAETLRLLNDEPRQMFQGTLNKTENTRKATREEVALFYSERVKNDKVLDTQESALYSSLIDNIVGVMELQKGQTA